MSTRPAAVLVFDTVSGVLRVHAESSTALRNVGPNVSSDLIFFAADGSPLRCERISGGPDYLRPWASCSACRLEQVVHLVRRIDGELPEELPPALKTALAASIAL